MTRLVFVPAPVGDTPPPDCTNRSLRLIEHYELDYHLSRDEPITEDSSEVAARRWTSFYCTGCQNDFTSRGQAFAHLGDMAYLLPKASP